MPSGTDKDRSPAKAAEQTGDDVGATKPASPANVSPPGDQATPPSATLLSMLRPPQADGELGRLAGFSILTLLGQGGMGAVFVAHDPIVRRKVALKVMKPEMTARPESYQRFLREARIAATVEHDHIISVYQVGEDNGVLFIAMPLLQGEALDRRLDREPRLPIPALLKVGRETAEGLAAAHAHELIHRDIKPGNLWLEGTDESGVGFRRVKILDFGLARAVHDDSHLTAAGGVLGTPAYMAPEQADGQTMDHRADLFSLGAVLYRCCTGTPPFAGPSTLAILSALANKTPLPVREKNPDVPPALADLIMRLLAKAPGDRPQTAAEVAATLRRLEQDCTAPPAVRRPRSRLALVCIAAVVALALATVAGVIVVKVRGPDGKESEVTAPEGSKINVDPKGNVTVTLPPNAPKPAPAPPAKQADPVELECRLKAEGQVEVRGLVVTPDGKRVIAGYGNGGLRVWELASRKIIKSFDTGSGVQSLALHPDGRTVAAVSGDGSLFTWDSETGEVVRRFTGHPVFSFGVTFARNGKSLVTPDSKSKTVLCWDVATGKHQVLAPYPDDPYGNVQVTPDGERVAVMAANTPVRILELPSGKSTWTSRWPGYGTHPVFTSDGKKIIIRGLEGIVVWVLKSKNPDIGYGVSANSWGLAISRDDHFLAAAGSTDREVQLWDLRGAGKPIRVWANPALGNVNRVAFSPDGRRLLSGHEDGTICVFTVPQDLPVWRGFAPLDPDWLARIAKLSPDDQVKEVAAELKRRNPGFNDPLQVLSKDEQGRVHHVKVETAQLEDLSPFRGFPALRGLDVSGKYEKRGRVWDLSCLKGMNLLYLDLCCNRVWDVSPLRDNMALKDLALCGNPIHDLSPLRNMKLQGFTLQGTNVDDISPLRGMPLEVVRLFHTRIKDLSPLSKAPLKEISVSAPDLEPLRDLPLELVQLLGDYKPEQIKMVLRIPTLKELQLADGKYDPEQLKEFRGNPILKTINDKPAAEFWKTDDKTIPDKKGQAPDDD